MAILLSRLLLLSLAHLTKNAMIPGVDTIAGTVYVKCAEALVLKLAQYKLYYGELDEEALSTLANGQKIKWIMEAAYQLG